VRSDLKFWRRNLKAEESDMNSGLNKDQIKGSGKDIGGKIQEEAGKLVGSKEQQIKGLEKQAEGKVQQQVGNLKAAVKDAAKS
jgi:uncharacterized protein YjbJ (UPF0337 family)